MPDLSPHKYSEDPRNGTVNLVEVKEYRLYQAKGRPDVYLQAGRFVSGDDKEYTRDQLVDFFGSEAIERFENDGIPPETMLLSDETIQNLKAAAEKSNELWAMSAMMRR